MVEHSPTFEAEGPSGLDLPNYLDLLRIVWHRKWLLIFGAVVGIGLGVLYYVQCVPIYQSEAQVLVVRKRPEAVAGSQISPSHFEDYVTTHRILIQSPLIVERAIERGGLRSLKGFAGTQEGLAQAIIANLTVGRPTSSGGATPNSVLRLAFRSTVPEECGTVVNAVLESYKSFLDETYRSMSDDTVALITTARNELENNLSKKEAEHREFREKTPMIWKGKEEFNPRQDRLVQIEAQRSALVLRQAQLEAQLATVERAREAGRSEAQLVALVTNLSGERESATTDGVASGASLQSQLLPLLLEEQTLLQDYGAKNPQVLAVRQRIESTRRFFAMPATAYSKAFKSAADGGQLLDGDIVELHIESLKQELDRLDTTDRLLTQLFEKEHEAARDHIRYQMREDEFRTNINRSQLLYDGLVKRLHDADLVKDYGGFDARIISPAGVGAKILPRRTSILGAFGLLGIAAGLALVYLAEVSDQRFRTPEEIRRRLGVPVIGHIPFIVQDRETTARFAENSKLDPIVIAHHVPRSVAAEAYRGVRTALFFSSAGEGHKVIQITSPGMADGKSSLASNLGVLIAQSGKKTLLIDADLRRPRLHKIFAASAEDGLSTVIAQRAEFSDAVQETSVPNLSILPSGPIPPDPAELLVSPRFPELLELLREKYDYVIVDSPPLLAVTDPCIVAPRVDALLLAIRITKNGRHQAKRAKEILNTLGVKVLGVVVNGLNAQTGGDYYGEYYAYGYGQGYESSEADDSDPMISAASGANGNRVKQIRVSTSAATSSEADR